MERPERTRSFKGACSKAHLRRVRSDDHDDHYHDDFVKLITGFTKYKYLDENNIEGDTK